MTRSKRIWSLNLSRLPTALNADRVTSRKPGSGITRAGEIQRYECIDCGKLFSVNPGFERMKHNPKAVTAAMQELLLRGITEENSTGHSRSIGTNVSHQTISNWITKYICLDERLRWINSNRKSGISPACR